MKVKILEKEKKKKEEDELYKKVQHLILRNQLKTLGSVISI